MCAEDSDSVGSGRVVALLVPLTPFASALGGGKSDRPSVVNERLIAKSHSQAGSMKRCIPVLNTARVETDVQLPNNCRRLSATNRRANCGISLPGRVKTETTSGAGEIRVYSELGTACNASTKPTARRILSGTFESIPQTRRRAGLVRLHLRRKRSVA